MFWHRKGPKRHQPTSSHPGSVTGSGAPARSAGEALEMGLDDAITAAQSYGPTVKLVYESDVMKTIREDVNMLADSLPGLVKALEEVAKLHPFISGAHSSYLSLYNRTFWLRLTFPCAVAVSAFRVVVELEMKGRDNDKKIGVLFVEMRKMMEALLRCVHTLRRLCSMKPASDVCALVL